MSQRGINLLDIIIILAVLALLILASVQEFPMYEEQMVSPRLAPSPTVVALPSS